MQKRNVQKNRQLVTKESIDIKMRNRWLVEHRRAGANCTPENWRSSGGWGSSASSWTSDRRPLRRSRPSALRRRRCPPFRWPHLPALGQRSTHIVDRFSPKNYSGYRPFKVFTALVHWVCVPLPSLKQSLEQSLKTMLDQFSSKLVASLSSFTSHHCSQKSWF